MTKTTTTNRKISDLAPDRKNANKGTVRGTAMLEDSLRKYGAGRSILADRNGNIIAGNKTLESAASIGMDNVIIVPTDGKQLVVVQRVDLDIDSKEGRELALADNRVGQVSLEWDNEVLQQLATEGVDLANFWDNDELTALLYNGETLEYPDGERGNTPTDALDGFLNATIKQVVLYFQNDEYEDVINRLQVILKKTLLTNHTAVFLRLLEHYEQTAP